MEEMPTKAKVSTASAGVLGILAASWAYGAQRGTELVLIALAGLVLVLLSLGGYGLMRLKWRRRQNALLVSELKQQGTVTPKRIDDRHQRAVLENLRTRFIKGIDILRSHNVDLYEIPWYLVVGELGSGKTALLRQSQRCLSVPEGLSDEYQGMGGTLNMDWWFFNDAVILDTAGRLVLEEVKSGETDEWVEFLRLLKKSRRHCPVNGLLLVISADSLIEYTAAEIHSKASIIARRLEIIQRHLDVRFPVFVIVSKCDRLFGFREFFDELCSFSDEGSVKDQIIGWSNPEALDVPFRAELVDLHIQKIVAYLRQLRMMLIGHQEVEAHDLSSSVFAFPQSLAAIGSPLRRYLEEIFVSSDSRFRVTKPLFLRGIYLSASEFGGSPADRKLVDAMGILPSELKTPKAPEQRRPYFLKDLFYSKIFPEQGLVTTATNTRDLMARRAMLVTSFAFCLLLVLFVFAIFSRRTLQEHVAAQNAIWSQVVRVGWHDGVWKQSIIRPDSNGNYVREVNTNKISLGTLGPLTLGELHTKLRDISTTELRLGLANRVLASGLAMNYNQDSPNAQRILFETSVIKPLVSATRQILRFDTNTASEAEAVKRQAKALAVLIDLEAMLKSTPGTTNLSQADVLAFANPLMTYIVGREARLDTNLVAVWIWTFTQNNSGRGKWPPVWLSEHRQNARDGSLSNYPALSVGLETLKHNLSNCIAAERQRRDLALANIRPVLQALITYSEMEQALLRAVRAGNDAEVFSAFNALRGSQATLQQVRALVNFSSLKEPLSADTGWEVSYTNVISTVLGVLDYVRATNNAALARTGADYLSQDIQRRLAEMQSELTVRMDQSVVPKSLNEILRIDQDLLANLREKASYEFRFEFYQAAIQIARTNKSWGGWRPSIKPLEDFLQAEIKPLREQATKYSYGFREEFQVIADYLLQHAEHSKSHEYFNFYEREAKLFLTNRAGFPLLSTTKPMSLLGLRECASALERIIQDSKSELFANLGKGSHPDWDSFLKMVVEVQRLADALSGDPPSKVTISLMPIEHKSREEETWRQTLRWVRLNDGERVAANAGAEETLGTIGFEMPIVVEMTDEAGKVKALQRTTEWGALRLGLDTNLNGTLKVDERTWFINWPLNSTDSPKNWPVGVAPYGGTLRLKLRFQKSLPDPRKWPQLSF